MYHARVLAASHAIYGRVVTEGVLLYTDCPKNSLAPLLQGQPARPGVPLRTKMPTHRRDQLERVTRYTARGLWCWSVWRKLPMGTAVTRSRRNDPLSRIFFPDCS